MRVHFTLALAGLAAAGAVSAGILFAAPAGASNVSVYDLNGLGYTTSLRIDASASPQCGNIWVLSGNGAPETLIGDPQKIPLCNTAAEIQSRIDQLIANYPPRPSPPTTVTVTQPAETVTLAPVTVTAPAVTVTGPTVTAPAVTIAAPSVVVTVPGAAPPAQIVTVTQTVTTTQMVRDPAQAAIIAKLRAKLAAKVNTRTGSRSRTSPHRRSRG